MSNPDLRIREFPVNPQTPFTSKTRIAPLTVVLMALVCLATLAATTPASAQATNFGSINVCPSGKTTPAPCSANQTVTFKIPAGTTITSIPILTTGIPDLDFKANAENTSTTLCKAKTYTSATTCTVDVTFGPLAPGMRKGAIELLDGTAVVAMNYVYGTGVGPAMAFYPSPPVDHLAPFFGYRSLTLDAAGNIFTTSQTTKESPQGPEAVSNQLIEIFAAGGYTTTEKIAGFSTLQVVGSQAIDGAGNIFLYQYSEDSLLLSLDEYLAVDDYSTIRALYSGSYADISGNLVLDSSGNLFFTDQKTQLIEMLAAGGYSTRKILISELDSPGQLAIDAAGNLFVASGDNSVNEILGAGGYTTVKNLPLPFPVNSLAVDAGGNLFVDGGNANVRVSEVLAAGGYKTIVPVALRSNQFPVNFALDSNGNFFYDSISNPSRGLPTYYLVEVPRSHPSPLLFGNSLVGGQSTQSVTLQNGGNATLTGSFSLIGDSEFSLAAGSGTPPDCADGFSLAPSGECDLSIDFAPQSTGTVNASLAVTDNASNQSSAIQAIPISGTGVTAIPHVSPAVLDFGKVPYTESATRSLTITNVGTGTLTIDPSSNGRGAIITGNTCGAAIGAGKSCTLQVELKPVQLGSSHNTLTIATNGTTNPTVPVLATATGVGSPSTTLDFGTVKGRGNSVTVGLDVVNIGVPGAVTVATETGATTFKVTYNDCTSGVTQGEDCNMNIEFAPVSTGPETAYLKLIPSVGPEQIIVMTGNLIP